MHWEVDGGAAWIADVEQRLVCAVFVEVVRVCRFTLVQGWELREVQLCLLVAVSVHNVNVSSFLSIDYKIGIFGMLENGFHIIPAFRTIDRP